MIIFQIVTKTIVDSWETYTVGNLYSQYIRLPIDTRTFKGVIILSLGLQFKTPFTEMDQVSTNKGGLLNWKFA